ncbi:MAG: universal stress protein, partial [bacterium]
MIKRILIPLDPSPYAESAMEFGCFIAKHHAAELTGLVVLDMPGIKKSVSPAPLGGIYYAEKLEKLKAKEAKERIQLLLSTFREKCQKEGVRYKEAEQQGSPSERIIRESIYYDAVVVGMETYFHFETTDKPGDSLDKLLNHAITPIYGVPKTFALPNIPDEKINVLLAFDGSLPSARALQRFAQLALPDLMNVMIVTAGEDKVAAEYYLEQAEAYLSTHSIFNIKKEWTSEDIIHA